MTHQAATLEPPPALLCISAPWPQSALSQASESLRLRPFKARQSGARGGRSIRRKVEWHPDSTLI